MKATELISILQYAIAEHGDSIRVGLPDPNFGYGAASVEGAEVRKHRGLEVASWESRDDSDLAPYYVAIH